MSAEESSRIKKLSNEILDKIFGYIDGGTLIRTSICKSWYDATGGEITRYASHENTVYKFYITLLQDPNFANKVLSLRRKKHERSMHFGGTYTYMDHLFPLCPNLAELVSDIRQSDITYYLVKLKQWYAYSARPNFND